jgi:pyruvate/2-oxoglutarate dehydrogenase complex dihydrolipoamide dehydrogenase (E3) component/uncharacterized membrane protein YdjX (TVP38/TMEM64 family)
MNTQYDIVVIGAGSGGLTAAVGFSKVGKKVLLVEREHMGGECTNSGCIPSKALLHHAKAYHAAQKITGETTAGETYRSAAFTYVRNIINTILKEETPETFKKLGIDVVMGEAVFTSKDTVTVKMNSGDEEDSLEQNEIIYTFKTAIIATGSSPRMIEINGLAEKHILTNQNIFTIQDVPKRLLVIGGGPIGMEMAQAFAMLGSTVTIAERRTEFARFEDPSIRPIIKQAFTDLGIIIHTGATIEKVVDTTAHFNHLQDEQITNAFTVEFDQVLIAIGRVANIPSGLELAGINTDHYGVTIDNQHRTSNKRVYAVGDVTGRWQFTHVADDFARQVVTRVTSKGLFRVSAKKSVPKVTYTLPEVAQVGMSWTDAVAKYSEEQVMRVEVSFAHNDRAKTDDVTDGLLVVVTKRISGRILGANIVGPAAGEILSIFTLAIDEKISMWKLQKIIYAYPTYSLIVKKAADLFVGRQIGDLKQDVLGTVKRQTPKIIAALVWIAAIVSLNQYQTTQGLTTTETAIQLFDLITMTIWGPLLYVVIYAVRPVTFFPATALTILSGMFFGFVWGTVLTVLAATVAAGVAYGVGRFFGANLRLEDSIIGNSITALRKNTFAAVLTMRLVFLPFDLLSYAAGMVRTKFIPFILATFLGIILGTATFVSIGASLNVEEFKTNGFSFNLFQPQFLALSILIFVVSLGLSRVLKRWQK